MIKRRQEMRAEPRFEVKGGKGAYDTLHIWEKTEIDKINLCGVNTLPPGSSIGVHSHQEDGEIYLVLQGQATVTEGGHSHGIANDSDEPLVFLALIMK